MMKKPIQKKIKEVIEDLEHKYATNYVAKKELDAVLEPNGEQRKQIDVCTRNMEKALEKITWYKELLKLESSE